MIKKSRFYIKIFILLFNIFTMSTQLQRPHNVSVVTDLSM